MQPVYSLLLRWSAVMLLLFSVTLSVSAQTDSLPEAKVRGSITYEGKTRAIQDAVAFYWEEYGAASNLLEIHLITLKLSPRQRKNFLENYTPALDLERVFGKKRSHDPMYDLPRVILQFNYQRKPNMFTIEECYGVGYSYTQKGVLAGYGGTSTEGFKVSGVAADGEIVTFEGSVRDAGAEAAEEASQGLSYSFTVKGTVPVLFRDFNP